MKDTTNVQNETPVIGQENDHGIVVFGDATATPETTPNNDAKETKPENKTDDKPSDANSQKQETVENKADDKPKSEAKPKEEKPKASDTTDKKETSKPSEGLKFDFGNNSEKPTDSQKPTDNQQETASVVTREKVLEYLNQNGFEGIKDISDLSKEVALPEQVEKFRKYHEETGRGIKDFYSLQRDWKSETPESRIKEYLRLKYPDLDEEQIQTQYDVVRVTEEDEDSLSSRELSRAKAEFDKMDSDAIAYLTSKSKEYEVPLQNTQTQAKPQSKEDIAKAHRPYWDARGKSLEKFNDFSFKIEGLGEIKVSIDSDDKKAIENRTETLDSMINSWRNKDNSLNTDNLVSDNAWAIPAVRQKLLMSIAEQVHTLTLENFSKENRNVDLDDPNKSSKQNQVNNGDMVVFGDKKSKQSQQFGQPIIPLK